MFRALVVLMKGIFKCSAFLIGYYWPVELSLIFVC